MLGSSEHAKHLCFHISGICQVMRHHFGYQRQIALRKTAFFSTDFGFQTPLKDQQQFLGTIRMAAERVPWIQFEIDGGCAFCYVCPKQRKRSMAVLVRFVLAGEFGQFKSVQIYFSMACWIRLVL